MGKVALSTCNDDWKSDCLVYGIVSTPTSLWSSLCTNTLMNGFPSQFLAPYTISCTAVSLQKLVSVSCFIATFPQVEGIRLGLFDE